MLNTRLVFRDLQNLYSELNVSRRNPKVFRLAFESYLYKSQQLTETMRSEYKQRTGLKWQAKDFSGWSPYTAALKKIRNAATHGCPIVLEEAQLSIYPNIEFSSDREAINPKKKFRMVQSKSFIGDPFDVDFPLQTMGYPKKHTVSNDPLDASNYVIPTKEFVYYDLRWDLLELGVLSGLPYNTDALKLVLKSFPVLKKYMEFYLSELDKNQSDAFKPDFWIKSEEKGGWVINPKYQGPAT